MITISWPHRHTSSSECHSICLASVTLQTLECARYRNTQFLFIWRITRFSYFFKPPHRQLQFDVNANARTHSMLGRQWIPLRHQCSVKSNTDRICHFTDFGSRKVVRREFHCPHVQSCMRCKYSISLWCRWCIIASQYVSILPLGKLFCSASMELLNWFWYVMLMKLSLLHFVYCTMEAPTVACRKIFFTCLAGTHSMSEISPFLSR